LRGSLDPSLIVFKIKEYWALIEFGLDQKNRGRRGLREVKGRVTLKEQKRDHRGQLEVKGR
jgi:hypothetical protein